MTTETPAAQLRDRIADALADADGWEWAPGFDKRRSPSYQEFQRQADAVLAVLGTTTGQPETGQFCGRPDCLAPGHRFMLGSTVYTCTGQPEAESCGRFVPDTPRAPGLCASCGDARGWHSRQAVDEQPETEPTVDRATVLNEAADWVEADGRYVQQLYGHQIGGLLRRRADEAQQPTPHPQEGTMTTETPAAVLRAAVTLLSDAESYLSALHGAVARHDNLGADLTCGGCQLRDRITPALVVARRVLGTTEQACPECGTSGACNGGPCALGTTEQADTMAAPEVPQPGPLTAAEGQFLAFALDQAAEELSLGAGFTVEASAALDRLRRLADEAQQPTPASAEETK